MIHYDLICEKGHEFDGWFADSAAYDSQAERGLVSCTICGSVKIEKQLMAPGIPAKSNKKADAQRHLSAGLVDPRTAQLMQMMRDYRQHVEANTEFVGENFAEEARKMHYNEATKRGIHGVATPDEVQQLVEEGIEIHPVPVLPEDGN